MIVMMSLVMIVMLNVGDESLGINMNIVSNVGQMFMFCVGSLLDHFWRCVWLLQGKGFCA